MRLRILEHGHRVRGQVFIGLVRLVTGQRLDSVAQMALYRPQFFGEPMLNMLSEIMRGPSQWTPAEREFLAVFTSRLNECAFCVRGHTETTRIESDGEVDAEDPGSVGPRVTAILPLLERATRTPELVSRSDLDAARAAGLQDEAIVDALYVNLAFNLINRLANAFDFSWDSDDHVRLGARVIHRISYRMPRFLMR